ncbi:cobalamin biosynthesis protein [Gordoniibacillus kamchatkensis]|uniref:Cobalamin biosynthesis protein n=1 Tax=Gordoniibacillus kamchatkensis TaxID=1590651 RepID=A0ABR5AHS0_9BACL|nr:CobW family GTP-binding protein [Paenibacillus sp. VKM B-2647]KIL40590.1 cobalamin biosynthesis protein [Paenibacillus sp. VKM B-2647]
MTTTIPIHILSGFLGSGKTTLLQKAIHYCNESGLKPAVIMNEIGDVNLDGLLIEAEVPTAELLSGCICCTIRGDLGMTIHNLYLENRPDVIFIECTGVANPIEIIDEVTDASLLLKVNLQSIITVVDAPHLLELSRSKQGKTYRLMQDQIRCANWLILNKSDKITSGELHGLEGVIREWNPHAPIEATIYSEVDLSVLQGLVYDAGTKKPEKRHECGEGCKHEHDHHDHHVHADGHVHEHHRDHDHDRSHGHHHTHDHVMAYTHYFDRAIHSEQFEEVVSKLPKEIFRAKGILQFTDTASRFLFQYAYPEMQFVKITPQANVPNVAVFIGESFSKETVKAALERL